MILTKNLSKFFGHFAAVKSVEFSISKGEIVGFIGPNGAGKTTTMRMLTGYLPATTGDISIAGHDVFLEPMEVRRKVGYLPETPPLYSDLTIGDYLTFVAEIREIPRKQRAVRIGQVMEQVGLQGWEKRIIRSLSKGYRQRVGLAQAIIHEPSVLILDEPTSGLDPAQVVGIRSFIRQLAKSRTVILSTHILSEVELLCQRVIVINKGEIMADGDLDEIRKYAGGVRYRLGIRSDNSQLAAEIGSLPEVQKVQLVDSTEGLHQLHVYGESDPRDAIASLAVQRGWCLRELEKVVPSLEEAFLSIIGAER